MSPISFVASLQLPAALEVVLHELHLDSTVAEDRMVLPKYHV